MNGTQAKDYIENINSTFCKPGTERVAELCRRMGNPQDKLSVVHVAGTNGKGSTCAMLESILLAAGYRVGLFSSPAILDFFDQIRVGGKAIDPEKLAALVEEAKEHIDQMHDKPTSFELLTVLAFLHFARQNCDIVIVEAGLGGKTDATNVISHPLLAIITGIALDHTAFLGNSIPAIAEQKAGIIKENAPVLFGGEGEEAAAVIADVAKQQKAPFYQTHPKDIQNVRHSLQGTRFDFLTVKDLSLPLLGLYQAQNALTALTALTVLRERDIAVSETAIRQGLAQTVWHARFEVLSTDPLVIYDGAHNPQGIAQAVKSIRSYFGEQKVLLISGVLRDKDYQEIASMLAPVTAEAFTVTPPSPRALSAKEYAQTLAQSGITATPFASATEAITAAQAVAKQSGAPILCLGSLYLYASIAPLFRS